MKKTIIAAFTVMFLCSCSPHVEMDPDSLESKIYCDRLCQKKFHINCDYVGKYSGTCYCGSGTG